MAGRCLQLIGLLHLLTALLAAQKPGAVEGGVVNSVTREPVKRAMVRLEGQNGKSSAATSDDSGAFQFSAVPPGSYVVSAQAQGYTRRVFKAVTVAGEQKVTGLAFALTPGGVISGKVADADGDPMPNAMVQALVYRYPQGARKLTVAGFTTANDRGEYRLHGLPPGRYYVMCDAPDRKAEPPGRMHRQGPEMEYAATYYPTSLEAAGAAPVDVAAGAETGGVDIRRQKIRLFHVRGKVTGLAGARGMTVTVGSCDRSIEMFGGFLSGEGPLMPLGLVPADGNLLIGTTAIESAPLQMDGTFDVAHVAPGAQCVTAQGSLGVQSGFARQTVNVSDKDVENVALALIMPFELRGSVVVEGTPQGPLKNLSLMMNPLGLDWGNVGARVSPDGAFAAGGVVPVTYALGMVLPASLYVRSIRLGSQESEDGRIQVTSGAEAMTIVVATDAGEVNGTVKSAGGDPASAMVAIVPAGTPFRMDRFRNGNSNAKGQFKVEGVPPGDYQVFALEQLDMAAIASPEYRQALEAKAARVTVHANGGEPVELTLISTDETDAALRKVQ